MKLLERLFGKRAGDDRLLVDSPQGIQITPEEAERLNKQHEAELAQLKPLQTRLKEETALLKQVIEFKLSPGDRVKVRELLKSGEDPALIAAYLKAPFRIIAVIANDVLKEVYGDAPDAPRIPTDLQEYIKLAQENAKKAAEQKS